MGLGRRPCVAGAFTFGSANLQVSSDAVMFLQLPGSTSGSMLGHLQGINKNLVNKSKACHRHRGSSGCCRQENQLVIPQKQETPKHIFPQTTALFTTCFLKHCGFMLHFLHRQPSLFYKSASFPCCPLCTVLLTAELLSLQ